MKDTLTGNLLVTSSLVTDPIYAGGVCLVVHQDESHVIGVMLNRPMKPSPEALMTLLSQSPEGNDAIADDGNKITTADPGDPSEGSDTSAGAGPINRLSAAHTAEEDSAALLGGTELTPTHPAANPATPLKPSPFGMLHFGGPLSGPVVAIHQDSRCAEAETGSGIYVAAQKQNLEQLFRGKPDSMRLIVGHLGWQVDQLEMEIEAGIWHPIPATPEVVFSAASEMWPRLIRRATSRSLARWIGAPDVVGAAERN